MHLYQAGEFHDAVTYIFVWRSSLGRSRSRDRYRSVRPQCRSRIQRADGRRRRREYPISRAAPAGSRELVQRCNRQPVKCGMRLTVCRQVCRWRVTGRGTPAPTAPTAARGSVRYMHMHTCTCNIYPKQCEKEAAKRQQGRSATGQRGLASSSSASKPENKKTHSTPAARLARTRATWNAGRGLNERGPTAWMAAPNMARAAGWICAQPIFWRAHCASR